MAFNSRNLNYDIFDDDSLSFSDDDGNASSEDEIDIILHGTPEQRRKLQHHHQYQGRNKVQDLQSENNNVNSSSEDEFEREMNAELNQQVEERNKISQKSVLLQSTNQVNHKNQLQTNSAEDKFYDEVYFDSDEEEDTSCTIPSRRQTHAVISNDELLYDPNMDDEDQKWVDKQRLSHRGPHLGNGKKLKMPNSDALLDCPACMTTLCLDCQRHETYKSQYRAMFVMNCVIDKSELLQCPEQAPKKGKNKRKVTQGASLTRNENPPLASDLFNPVRCTECNTVVGVVDNDEVYHFFNVLASHT